MKTVGPVLFALAVFLFWLIACPHLLSFHEQNQLFLFDWKYLAERLSVSGGLADWCGEFIVQFFCYPFLGALMMSLLFSGLQLALSRLFANMAFSFAAHIILCSRHYLHRVPYSSALMRLSRYFFTSFQR